MIDCKYIVDLITEEDPMRRGSYCSSLFAVPDRNVHVRRLHGLSHNGLLFAGLPADRGIAGLIICPYVFVIPILVSNDCVYLEHDSLVQC